jgi:molecular chaperone IbpA
MSGALARTHVAQVENVAMRPYDFSPLWRSTIGFDRMFDLLNTEISQDQETYPPYDIARTGEERYRISVALVGFAPEQTAITVQQNRLTVAGKKTNENKENYVFQSIPTRDFERHFSLADYVELEGATFENGLLQIDLVRKLPEAMKPRRIEIGTSLPSGRLDKAQCERVPRVDRLLNNVSRSCVAGLATS